MKKSFLSIETSLNRIFLVLYVKDNLISNSKILEESIEVEINQMFDEILEQAKALFFEINYIMVSLGPGSYTGTRVGLAAAKAIALSINKPIFGYTNFNAIYNQGIIDSIIKSNSNTGVIIKASKYDAYYQQIKKNFFSNYKVISTNNLNSDILICEKTLGNYYKIDEIKNYYFCLPKKEAIFKIFLKYLENENNYKNKNLEPLYIKGHYAEK
ncbi:tRNA (adenosine(37)-N6)-threonylcarbamoyltransferase complex dimerization subunit type 1 TsaB [Alphaproteobacteria bacterium]|nr:tRNA (adenosine(37)-N6)-threonylcarbamoyltransferase complex dimerization subunit type 1 TsaB [Alphaproteobacteria bacterium]